MKPWREISSVVFPNPPPFWWIHHHLSFTLLQSFYLHSKYNKQTKTEILQFTSFHSLISFILQKDNKTKKGELIDSVITNLGDELTVSFLCLLLLLRLVDFCSQTERERAVLKTCIVTYRSFIINYHSLSNSISPCVVIKETQSF